MYNIINKIYSAQQVYDGACTEQTCTERECADSDPYCCGLAGTYAVAPSSCSAADLTSNGFSCDKMASATDDCPPPDPTTESPVSDPKTTESSTVSDPKTTESPKTDPDTTEGSTNKDPTTESPRTDPKTTETPTVPTGCDQYDCTKAANKRCANADAEDWNCGYGDLVECTDFQSECDACCWAYDMEQQYGALASITGYVYVYI